MTTIAFKDGIMACDSLASEDTFKADLCRKIYKLDDGRVVGFCGSLAPAMRVIEDLKNGKGYRDIEYDDETYFVIYDKGRLYYLDRHKFPIEQKTMPYAIGSGAYFAMGAMLAGASAREAVTIACKLDTNSSLPIYSVNCS